MKKLTKMIGMAAMTFCMAMATMPAPVMASENNSEPISYGVDIGDLSQLESLGYQYADDNGNVGDALEILHDKGVTAVRIRAFVNPDESFTWTKNDNTECYLGYCDTAGVLYTAERAHNLGMDINLVFHYSDHFADPQYQDIPEQWKDATEEELSKYVYDYTYYLMNELAQKGIYPKWVEVGNEINAGILFPYGSSMTNFERLAEYLNSGYDAVKAVSPNTKVVTHLANVSSAAIIKGNFTWFFDNYINTYGGKTDVIGMSYYPYWTAADIDGVTRTLSSLASTYDKEVMICETGGLETDEAGTYALLRKEINALRAVPNNKGVALFYWEPEVNSAIVPDGYTLGATKMLNSNTLQFTSALDAFSEASAFLSTENYFAIYNCNSEKVLNVSGGSSDNEVNIEQYDFDDWASQEWKFEIVEDSYYKIVNKNSGKVLDVEAMSTTSGTSVIQYEYNGGWNQMWSIETTDDGKYRIKNRLSGMYLSILGSSTEDGAWCVQSSDISTDAASWYLLVTE